MGKSEYHHVEDDEWMQVDGRDLRHACCDCGVIHDMKFRIRKGKIEYQAKRNPHATAGMRRSFKFNKD
jgi:hypothetical protein